MNKQEFVEKMQELIPGATHMAVDWSDWLYRNGVAYEEMSDSFYGVHQQYGGELSRLLFIKGPRHYCLYPNEFMLAAEYLYNGGAIEQIDERPSHTGQENNGFEMEMKPRG